MLKKIIGKNKILMLILGIIVGILISVVSVYAVDKIDSKNVTYNHEKSNLKSTNVQDALDELYNRVNMSLSSYIVSLYAKSNNKKDVTIGTTTLGTETITQAQDVNLMQDFYGNIRYYGKNPNNYIEFNNEIWRIIGIANNHVKIIKKDFLKVTPWEPSDNNNWNKATLQTYLNTNYYNEFNDNTKQMINKSIWYLGGAGFNKTDNNYYGKFYANNFYAQERSTTVYSGNPNTWTGNIGLIYPSDYLYATDLSVCNKTGYDGTPIVDGTTGNDYRDPLCKDNNWLFTNSYNWTITHTTSFLSGVFVIDRHGNIIVIETHNSDVVYPVLYLKSSVIITGGDGSSNNPYQIKLV